MAYLKIKMTQESRIPDKLLILKDWSHKSISTQEDLSFDLFCGEFTSNELNSQGWVINSWLPTIPEDEDADKLDEEASM